MVIPISQLKRFYSESSHLPVLLYAVAALLLLGLVMVYSATIALPDAPKYAAYSREHFLLRQALFIALGVLAGLALFQAPTNVLYAWSSQVFVCALFLLVLVLMPGAGREVNGARRWLALPGASLQPSEFMKLAILLYCAAYAVRRRDVLHSLRRGFGPVSLVTAIVGILLIMEPDLGAFAVIVAITMGILFIGGINAIWFGGLSALLVAVFAVAVIGSPWRRDRLFAYLDPWQLTHALGKAYQLSHSLIAFGRGSITGVGLGGSIEKLHYLPEAHTDFLLSLVGEELGLLAVVVVICLFYLVARTCLLIGRQAIAMERHFAGLIAQGAGIWLGVQAFINMAVTLGLLPTKGLTLPFMSYGGSGLIMNCAVIGMVARVDYENNPVASKSRARGGAHQRNAW